MFISKKFRKTVYLTTRQMLKNANCTTHSHSFRIFYGIWPREAWAPSSSENPAKMRLHKLQALHKTAALPQRVSTFRSCR